MGKKPRNKINPQDDKRSLTRVSMIPSDNNNPLAQHLTKKQKLTDNPSQQHPPKKQKLTDNAITPPPEPPSTTTDDLRKLIQKFTHSQLTELLITASLNHPDVLDDVRALDVTQRKLYRLYVVGLHLKTTSASLRSVFAPYGELEQAMVIKNKATPKSNRYGLVIYKHVDSAVLALKEPSKVIDGRMSFSMLANGTGVFNRIVYVENVTSGMSAEKLLECFQEYGEVEEGPLGFDTTTGEFKGFAFIIYKNVDGAKACLVDPVKCVDGCELLCKLANDKKVKPFGRMSFSMLANSTSVFARLVYVENVASGMSAEKLLECFQEYGEVEEGPVGFDKTTGEFKGFPFIIYKNVDGAKECLVDPVKCVDGRELRCRLANDNKVKPGGRMFFRRLANSTSVFARMVCVENVTSGMSAEKLLECFQEYGEVEEGPVGFDKTTGEFKGFPFIIYKNVDGAKACLVDPVKCVDGCELRCRPANDKKVKPGGVAALVTADTQGDVVKPKVVNSDQQSLMQVTFGSSGVTASGGNSCGLVGGIQGYGGGGQAMSLSAQVIDGRRSFSMLANSTSVFARIVYVENVTSGMSAEKLLECFQEYGEVEEGPVGFDKTTGEFKGFAFIIYKNVDGAKACLVYPVKCVDGRELRCRLANDKKVKPGGRMFFRRLANSTSVFARIVYVENVTSGMSAEKLLECFQEYGEVEEGLVGFDKTTDEFKGFAFIIYKNVDGAKASLVDLVKCVDGRELHCRLANDKKVKPGRVAALVTADTQGDLVKPKVVNSDQQSLMQGTFGSSGITASCGNSCGLVGTGGIQGYGGGGHGMSLSAQVQGPGDGVRPEVVNSNQQSSMQGSFASQFGNGGPSVGSSCGGNSGGLGLQGGPGGTFGYGILGPGPPLGHSHHPLNLGSGGGSAMSSFGSGVDGMGLSTSAGLPPSSLRVDGGGFSGDSHLGGPGASYGGKGSCREAGLGPGFGPFGGRGSSYGGTESGGGTGLSANGSQALRSLGGDNGGLYGGSHFGGPGLSYGGMGSGVGVELRARVGGAGPNYGGIGSGLAGLGSGFGGSDASFVRQSSGREVGLSDSLGGPSTSYGVSGSGRGVGLGGGFGGLGSSYGGPVNGGEAGLGTGFNEPGARYGGMGNGGAVELGSGFGPLGQRSRYGLSPGSVRKSSGGAHYSLSSGSADQTQLQQKKYQGAHYKL